MIDLRLTLMVEYRSDGHNWRLVRSRINGKIRRIIDKDKLPFPETIDSPRSPQEKVSQILEDLGKHHVDHRVHIIDGDDRYWAEIELRERPNRAIKIGGAA